MFNSYDFDKQLKQYELKKNENCPKDYKLFFTEANNKSQSNAYSMAFAFKVSHLCIFIVLILMSRESYNYYKKIVDIRLKYLFLIFNFISQLFTESFEIQVNCILEFHKQQIAINEFIRIVTRKSYATHNRLNFISFISFMKMYAHDNYELAILFQNMVNLSIT